MGWYGKLFKSADGLCVQRYTVAVLGGGYFEGVKKLGDFSEEKVQLYYAHALIEVSGKGLKIAKFLDGDLQIDGKITGVLQIETGSGEN